MMTKIYNTLGRSRGKKELENNHFGGDDLPVIQQMFGSRNFVNILKDDVSVNEVEIPIKKKSKP